MVKTINPELSCSTDGVGLGLAIEFCRKGFNICLIARNQQKLQDVENKLQNINPQIQTRSIVADFINCHQDGFFDQIHNQLKDLDIAILVGISKISKFSNIDPIIMQNTFVVNILSQILMTRKLINQMDCREKKSLILNISSQSCIRPLMYTQVYGSTKLFNKYFSVALSLEQDKMDIVSLNLGYVSTALTANKQVSFSCLTIDECTKGVVRQLGYGDREIHTNWKHQICTLVIQILPNFILGRHRQKEMKQRENYLSEQSQKKQQ